MPKNTRPKLYLTPLSTHSHRRISERYSFPRPRLNLSAEQFRVTSPFQKTFSIADLSFEGLGIWLLEPQDQSHFAVGLALSGTLNLNREKYPIQARVRHLSSDRVGFMFEKLSLETQQALKHFLSPFALGAALKPIPSSIPNTLWYLGPSGTDFQWTRGFDGQCEKFILFVLKMLIQWQREEGLLTAQTSLLEQPTETSGILRKETLVLHPDPTPDPEKLSIAKTVILGSNLPQDLKSWCVRQLEE